MKRIFKITFIFLVVITSSCSIEKRVHQPGFYIDFNSNAKSNIKQNKNAVIAKSVNNPQATNVYSEKLSEEVEMVSADLNTPVIIANIQPHKFKDATIINSECDILVYRNGDELLAKVTEVLSDEIKFKRCDNLNGPIYSIKKSEVFMIKYVNGSKEVFTNNQQNTSAGEQREQRSTEAQRNNELETRGVETVGLIGFILSILGLIIAGIPLGIAAVITGAISLNKINRDPNRFSGAGFAVAAIIIGIIAIIGAIIAISAM